MSAFCEDRRQILKYPNGIIGKPRPADVPLIECLQWSDIDHHASSFETVQDFIGAKSTPGNTLRVAFLPVGPAMGDYHEAQQYRRLFEHYSVPSTVPAERMRNVGMSFGTTRNHTDKSEGVWFHFLCRRVEIQNGIIQGPSHLKHGSAGQNKGSPFKMWYMADFYLHISPDSEEDCDNRTLTLLNFGAPIELSERFNSLLNQDQNAWKDVLGEPYLLFDILFDELHGVFDRAVWELSKVVQPEEKKALQRADLAGERRLDFQNLHDAQTNTAYMIEAAENSITLLAAMITELQRKKQPKDLTTAAGKCLEYRKRGFQSTLARLRGLDKRMSNIFQLSNSIMTHADSAMMKADSATLKADSKAMKLIAFLTLVFLPATSVASIFSTPFFDIDWQSAEDEVLRTAKCFWVFWAVAAPLTLTGLLLYFAWIGLRGDKKWMGKFAPFRRERGMTRSGRSSRAFGKGDLESGESY